MEGLSAQSCDSTWTPRYLSDSETFAYKLLKLGSLAMYWDILEPSQLLGDLSVQELVVSTSCTHFCLRDFKSFLINIFFFAGCHV